MLSIPFKACAGLNTVAAPDAASYDLKTGEWEATGLVNLDVLHAGRLQTRPGFSQVLTGNWHSPFQDGDIVYLAKDDTIYSLGPDFSPVALTDGLTAGQRVAWCRLGQVVYWSNGVQKGRIVDGQAKAWGGITFSSDAREAAEYRDPPAGTVLAAFGGRIWIGAEREIYYTVPGFPHHCRVGSCRLAPLSSAVRMIAPVEGGFYIGTDDRIIYQSSVDPGSMTATVVSREPVIPGSFVSRLASDILPEANGILTALWATARGLELGLPGGQIIKLTHQRVAMRAPASWAAMLSTERRIVAILHP